MQQRLETRVRPQFVERGVADRALQILAGGEGFVVSVQRAVLFAQAQKRKGDLPIDGVRFALGLARDLPEFRRLLRFITRNDWLRNAATLPSLRSFRSLFRVT